MFTHPPFMRTASSSLGVPFVLFSDDLRGFVQTGGGDVGSGAYTPDQLHALGEHMVGAYVDGSCGQRPTALVVDFEGEMLGFGGEMTVATFLPYMCEMGDDERGAEPGVPLPGLCVDMTGASGVALCKRLMEAPTLCKLGWGVGSDLAAMLHQTHPRPLDIRPTCLVDVQLRFSESPTKRLGLHRASERILRDYPDAFDGLPDKKECIDWDTAFAQNERAMPFPLAPSHMVYALDDVHRIERVLRHVGGWTPSADEPELHETAPLTVVCSYDQQVYRLEGVPDGEPPRPLDASAQHLPPELLCIPTPPTPAPTSDRPLAPLHSWFGVERMSTYEQSALAADPYGLRWFYRQLKTYRTACRNRHPEVQRKRRAVLLRRHLANVWRQCGGTLETVLGPSDVRRLTAVRAEVDAVLVGVPLDGYAYA